MLKVLLSTRTNNFNDPNIVTKITSLWEKAQEALIDHTENIYGVYYNYESSYKGDYTLSVAVKADKNGSTNSLIALSKNYRKFVVDECTPEKIFQTWQHIWQLEETGELNRQYDVDYEEYCPDGTVTIFISIK